MRILGSAGLRVFEPVVRAIPADPVIVRQNWLAAYDFLTDKGAVALNDYARANDPFAKVGRIQVAVDISSVIRASNDSFRVAWVELSILVEEAEEFGIFKGWFGICSICDARTRILGRIMPGNQANVVQ